MMLSPRSTYSWVGCNFKCMAQAHSLKPCVYGMTLIVRHLQSLPAVSGYTRPGCGTYSDECSGPTFGPTLRSDNLAYTGRPLSENLHIQTPSLAGILTSHLYRFCISFNRDNREKHCSVDTFNTHMYLQTQRAGCLALLLAAVTPIFAQDAQPAEDNQSTTPDPNRPNELYPYWVTNDYNCGEPLCLPFWYCGLVKLIYQ